MKAAEEGKSFIVQYMGQRPVDKIDGLDTVKPVVQVREGHSTNLWCR